MEGENRLRGDPAARSRSGAEVEEAGRKPVWGREEAKPLGPRLSRVHGARTCFAQGIVAVRPGPARAWWPGAIEPDPLAGCARHLVNQPQASKWCSHQYTL